MGAFTYRLLQITLNLTELSKYRQSAQAVLAGDTPGREIKARLCQIRLAMPHKIPPVEKYQ